MRIYAEGTTGIFQMGQRNPSMNQRCTENAKQPAERRMDTAAISPRGKSSSVLANLMNQKELIQMNKDSLIKRSLDEESGIGASNLSEQLEEYEKQLEDLDRQIASEMTKQAENEPGTENTYQNPQNTNASDADENISRLTELSTDLDQAQTSVQAQTRREGEKRVCETEIETGGSVAAKHKLEKLEEKEWLTAQIKPVLKRLRS